MNARSAKSTVTSIDPDTHDGEDGVRGDDPTAQAQAAREEDLADLERRLEEAADTLKESAKVMSDLASRQIRAHPLAAFGVAFFAGLTAARLLRR